MGAHVFIFLTRGVQDLFQLLSTKKNPNDSDLRKVQYIKTAYEKMQSVLFRYQMPGMVIDTTELNEEAVVELMISELQKRGMING